MLAVVLPSWAEPYVNLGWREGPGSGRKELSGLSRRVDDVFGKINGYFLLLWRLLSPLLACSASSLHEPPRRRRAASGADGRRGSEAVKSHLLGKKY